MGFSTTPLWTGLFLTASCLVSFSLLRYFIEILVFNVNSADTNQMPHSVASDLGLYCLPISLLGVSRLKRVKEM